MSSLAYHLSCPCPVSTLYLLHISSQNITSKYWLHPVWIPLLLPMCSHSTICTAHFQSEYHVFYLSFLPMSNLNTTFTAHVQSEYHLLVHLHSVHHLYLPCPVSTPSLQPISYLYTMSKSMSKKYPISISHDQSVSHLYTTCPIFIPSLLPMSR